MSAFAKLKAKVAQEKKAARVLRDHQASFVQKPITAVPPEFHLFGVRSPSSAVHKASYRRSQQAEYKPPTWFQSPAPEKPRQSSNSSKSRRSCKFIDNSAVEEDSDGQSIASEASSCASKDSGPNFLDYPPVPRTSSTVSKDSGPNWLDDSPEDPPAPPIVSHHRKKFSSKYKCPICNKSNFTSEKQLDDHCATSKCLSRSIVFDKKYRCRKCRKKCGNRSNLSRHEAVCKKSLRSDISK